MPLNVERRWPFLGLLVVSFFFGVTGDEGDACQVKANIPGICRASSGCDNIEGYLRAGALTTSEVPSCGYGLREEIICCPTTACCSDSTSTTTIRPNSTSRVNGPERPAVAACSLIRSRSEIPLTLHILDGVPVERGIYPHMAAIAYNSFGEPQYLCGGSLIASRFVLTAAHCVNTELLTPVYVRLGAVDIEKPKDGYQDIAVSNVMIHPSYVSSSKYYDVAILELAEEAKFSEFIRPACLYPDIQDPPLNAKLFVSGWGVINVANRDRSKILLRAPLDLVPLDKCNASFADQPLSIRALKRGIIESMLCAADSKMKKDACQGDSGGPLVQDVDIVNGIYYVVGVISSGFGCATNTPGLYMRVASFLDYIEGIVWPGNRV